MNEARGFCALSDEEVAGRRRQISLYFRDIPGLSGIFWDQLGSAVIFWEEKVMRALAGLR
ncbi:MAG: hypothetical protein V4773_16275 [Verrucomicrobiota bacterium]